MRHREGLDTTALQSPAIQEAAEVLSMLDQTPLERERYESRLKAQRDYSIGLHEGRMEGMEEGEKKGIQTVGNQIEKLYRFKFGVPSSSFSLSIQSVNDLTKLAEIYDALLQAESVAVFQNAITPFLSPSS